MMFVETPSLLITDDDRDFRETLDGVFQSRGFQTFLAEDGQQALEIVQTESVHLVLLDMHMPRLTGLETIRRVKQLDGNLPCILLSAGLTELLTEQAFEAQAFSVLAKPIRFAVINGVVNQALHAAYGWDHP